MMMQAKDSQINSAWNDSDQKYRKYVHFSDFRSTRFVFLDRTPNRAKFFNFSYY